MERVYNNIVVLGAGESGNGAAILARRKGYAVFVSDNGPIKPHYKQELEEEGIGYEENGHTADRIMAADLVIKSPGIPEKVQLIKNLRAAGKEIISEIEWAYRFKGDSRIVAITGSNGKSTTTSLLYYLLHNAGLDVSMVGNIGISFAKQVALSPTAWYVIEVSSFQLDDITSFRAEIGVLLNITPDHLDRYEYKFENYIKSKFRIAAFQTENDMLILNIDDPEITRYLAHNHIKPKIISITMSEQNLPQDEGAFMKDEDMHIKYEGDDMKLSIHDLALKGKHNQYNSMAAGISARAAGIRKEKIRESFSTFEGLEHRLEFVATVRGVDFINDSKGTNLNSVWFALESMKQPVVLILGGQDKGNDYNEIMDLVQEKVRAIVCMGIDNAPIHKAFENVIKHIVDTQSAKDAVNAAYSLAEKGDVVLLSPGCASFDLFKNYEDRGTQFKQAVREL
ncbi:UDP-N-acetylmuramoyl-L-alanine--D-glutamate ligase [Taibaiella chishuiensis]|uniref:UDP-N-acetylmuramoylalanine--D-glutamate ligase n=1 Tax=Taibaiella chishuiensis TaxID=1434707 RepID=A0A2P8DC23_9BACT|nr:UDP-N-acetylmuramoyl-L-alanine--D-glutamate ligase [Taibaiella chishuiensis]PSK94735.1 UDP-N-acetylmuramoylalanine--D-glutamate ligase [Taibaiella chishuiensis]